MLAIFRRWVVRLSFFTVHGLLLSRNGRATSSCHSRPTREHTSSSPQRSLLVISSIEIFTDTSLEPRLEGNWGIAETATEVPRNCRVVQKHMTSSGGLLGHSNGTMVANTEDTLPGEGDFGIFETGDGILQYYNGRVFGRSVGGTPSEGYWTRTHARGFRAVRHRRG